jgi:hypothetical protein
MSTNKSYYEDGEDALAELRVNGLGGVRVTKAEKKDPFEEDADFKAFQTQTDLFNKQNMNNGRYSW